MVIVFRFFNLLYSSCLGLVLFTLVPYGRPRPGCRVPNPDIHLMSLDHTGPVAGIHINELDCSTKTLVSCKLFILLENHPNSYQVNPFYSVIMLGPPDQGSVPALSSWPGGTCSPPGLVILRPITLFYGDTYPPCLPSLTSGAVLCSPICYGF